MPRSVFARPGSRQSSFDARLELEAATFNPPILAAENALAFAYLTDDPTRWWPHADAVDPAISLIAGLHDQSRGIPSLLLRRARSEQQLDEVNAAILRSKRQSALDVLERIIASGRRNIDPGLLSALDTLRSELSTTLVGRDNSLRPAIPHHRPGDSSLRQMIKALAIASVDLLMRFDIGLEGACRSVAKALKRAKFEFASSHSQTPDWIVVDRWRGRISRFDESVQERHTVMGLRDVIGFFNFKTQSEAEDHVRRVLTKAVKSLSPLLG